LAFALAACGGRANLQVATHLSPSSPSTGADRALARILEAFAEQEPGIRVEVLTRRWDTMTERFLREAAEGEGPDIQWVPPEDLAKAVTSGELAPLRRLLGRRWWSMERSDLLAPPDAGEVTVPVDVACYGLFYRADLFEAEGVTVPFADWQAMAAAAEKLTVYDDYIYTDRYGIGMGLAPEDSDLPPVVSAALAALPAGVGASDPLGSGSQDVPQRLAEGFGLLKALREAGVLHPEVTAQTAEEVYRAFNAGSFGMILGSTSRFARVRREIVVADPPDVRFLPVPSVAGGPATPATEAWHVGIRRSSRVRRQAARFVRFLLSPAADAIWVEEAGHVPLRRSTLERRRTRGPDADSDHLVAAARLLAGGGWREPASRESAPWRRALARATVEALRGASDPETAFAGALSRAEPSGRNY
jgi:ABC-type glycerol-3-phosphate transport system substrate-binding protein